MSHVQASKLGLAMGCVTCLVGHLGLVDDTAKHGAFSVSVLQVKTPPKKKIHHSVCGYVCVCVCVCNSRCFHTGGVGATKLFGSQVPSREATV
jgi:hypothetical protein